MQQKPYQYEASMPKGRRLWHLLVLEPNRYSNSYCATAKDAIAIAQQVDLIRHIAGQSSI